jgi:hypothetical protein
MIIVFEPYGQLSNRLFLSAYGMALAKASGQQFFNLSLGEYSHLFPATRPRFNLWMNYFHRCMRALIVRLKGFPIARRWFVSIDRQNAADHSPDNSTFLAAVKQRTFTFIEGWPDLSRISFPAASADAIRATFEPAAQVTQLAQETVRLAKGGADVLVGLHMRLGDYKSYRHGIFHYQLQDYRLTLERMTALFPGRHVAFLICSNEHQKAEEFVPFQVTIGPATLLGDLYSLAGCDYLVGPPSTYSLWAAFYGGKPLYHMVEPEPPTDLSAFMIPDGHFECIDLKLDNPEIESRRRARGTVSSDQ